MSFIEKIDVETTFQFSQQFFQSLKVKTKNLKQLKASKETIKLIKSQVRLEKDRKGQKHKSQKKRERKIQNRVRRSISRQIKNRIYIEKSHGSLKKTEEVATKFIFSHVCTCFSSCFHLCSTNQKSKFGFSVYFIPKNRKFSWRAVFSSIQHLISRVGELSYFTRRYVEVLTSLL